MQHSKHRPGSFPHMLEQPKPPLPKRPISPKENMRRLLSGEKPVWMPATMMEVDYCWPAVILEHPQYEYDGKDWFDVDWTWVEVAGGMMVTPGTRNLSDVSKWREEVKWPDLDSVPWEEDAKRITASYHDDRMHMYQCTEGIFERLHELMPFEDTLAAFIEEPEHTKDFFNAMADYKIAVLEKVFQHYEPIDIVVYNDDWGTARSGFFSMEMFKEFLLEPTKRVIQFIKSKGKFVELHSCGLTQMYIPYMLEMGFDAWTPQAINDSAMLKAQYGDKMTFGFTVEGLDKPGITEDEVRQCVRRFVDSYGAGGRCIAFMMAPPDLASIAQDELFTYSYEFYKK